MTLENTYSGIIKAETSRAILLESRAFKGWLPKSKVTIAEISHLRAVPRQAQVSLPEWLAREKGLL